MNEKEEMWGEALVPGFQMLPDVLIKNQGNLGISPTEFVVLMNISLHWWYPDRFPFPHTSTIAKRMHASERTVRRAIKGLEDRNLLNRTRRRSNSRNLFPKGHTYDLTPLVEKLQPLAISDSQYESRKNREKP